MNLYCRTMHLFKFLLLTLLVKHANVNALISCDNVYSCQSQYIAVTTDNVWCNGYRSCYNASINTNNSFIECAASYSCYNSTLVMLPSDSKDIDCFGLFSCANSMIIANSTNDISCSGESSCINSIIRFINDTSITDSNLNCEGFGSCDSSQIYAARRFNRFYGSYSGQNCAIYTYSNSMTTFTFYFYGAYSGNGSTIYCSEYSTCAIFCYGLGCYNLSVACVSAANNSLMININSSSCSIQINCYSASVSDLCTDDSIGIDSIDVKLIAAPNIKDTVEEFSQSTIENSDNLCYNDTRYPVGYSGLVCDSYYECQFAHDLDTSVNGSEWYGKPICCLGRYSCDRAIRNITSEIMSTIDIDINGSLNLLMNQPAVRCDGDYSCRRINNMINLITNGGDIYLSGQKSGYQSRIRGVGEYNTTTTNVYCVATLACEDGMIEYFNNVFAMGYFTVRSSTVVNVKSIYCYAGSSCAYAFFTNIGTIHCASFFSCSQLTVSNVDTIISYNDYSMYRSNFTDINGYVVGYGVQSLRDTHFEATIGSGATFTCHGQYCAEDSTITGFDNITVNGEYALLWSTISCISDTINVIGEFGLEYVNLINSIPGFDNTNSSVCNTCP